MLHPYPGFLWHWRTELPEVSGTGMSVLQKLQSFRVRVIPGVNTTGMALCVRYRPNENRKFENGYDCRTQLTDVPGSGKVVHNSQTFRVRVGLYRTHRSPGYGYFQGKYPLQKGRKNNKQLDWSKKDTMNVQRISNCCDWHTGYTDALIGNNTYIGLLL